MLKNFKQEKASPPSVFMFVFRGVPLTITVDYDEFADEVWLERIECARGGELHPERDYKEALRGALKTYIHIHREMEAHHGRV